jgi:SAM-dependent methyltransferase
MGRKNETAHNRDAWDAIACSAGRFFHSVTRQQIEDARQGKWSVSVTATRPVPPDWLGNVPGKQILCLGSGGGQQGPILAAAGANVTVVDISAEQLAIDTRVARESSLPLITLESDMCSMPSLSDRSFDLVLNPCSVNYVRDVTSVWRECARLLRDGGVLIAGLLNPLHFLFDPGQLEKRKFVVSRTIPCEIPPLDDQPTQAIEFAHTLDDLIGGQMRAGFGINGFIEDRWGGRDPLSDRIPVFIATRAVRYGGVRPG